KRRICTITLASLAAFRHRSFKWFEERVQPCPIVGSPLFGSGVSAKSFGRRRYEAHAAGSSEHCLCAKAFNGCLRTYPYRCRASRHHHALSVCLSQLPTRQIRTERKRTYAPTSY